jgi:FkbM family methyltransferase
MDAQAQAFLNRVYAHETEDVGVTWRDPASGITIRFHTPNIQSAARSISFGIDEPETIEWFGQATADDIIFDIGANIGLYSVYAAKRCGARVCAFEPASQNFAVLCKNVAQNEVSALVQAYPVGVSDRTGLDTLFLDFLVAGKSGNQVGVSRNPDLEPVAMAYRQGIATVALDEAIAKGWLPQPTRLKMDVDGIEHLIIQGGERMFRDARLRTAIIEINAKLAEHQVIPAVMAGFGFRYEEPRTAQRERVGSQHYNYIFTR